MKNILITTDYRPSTGGVANYYGNLVDNFPEKLEVIFDNDKLSYKHGPFRWRKAIAAILESISDTDKLIVGQIIPLGTAAYIASLWKSFDYYPVLHGMDFSLATRNPWKRWLTKKIISRSKGIVCANSEVARQLMELVPEARHTVINPGLGELKTAGYEDRAKELISSYNFEGKSVILSVGRLVRRKGFDMVINALAKLNDDNFVYVICGDGEDREYLENLAKEKGVNTIFAGRVSEPDKWAWIYACELFAMPSRNIDGDFEGFGIVFLEAQSMGKAVIGGKSGGIADAIIDQETGILVNPENIDEIAEAINKLHKNPNRREILGEAGQSRAKKEFDWKKLAQDMYNFIN